MPVLTIRDVDDTVKSALEARAKEEGVSQAHLARRLLADALGVRIKKRDLVGLPERVFGEEGARQLAEIDWTQPSFTDEELNAFMDDDAGPEHPVRAAE